MVLISLTKSVFQWACLLSTALLLVACQTPSKVVDSGATGKWSSDAKVFRQGYKEYSSLSQWRYSAKVGVVTPEESNQANMIWQFDSAASQQENSQQASNVVRLFGPLGIGAIKIEFDDQSVQLSDRTGILHKGSSAENLLHRIVGWPIPVEALQYWLFSLPQPEKQFEYQLDEQGQLQVLRQFGWEIEYSDYRDYRNNAQLLARKIIAKKQASPDQEVTVTLVTKTWK